MQVKANGFDLLFKYTHRCYLCKSKITKHWRLIAVFRGFPVF